MISFGSSSRKGSLLQRVDIITSMLVLINFCIIYLENVKFRIATEFILLISDL